MKSIILYFFLIFIPMSSFSQDFSGIYNSGQISLILGKNESGEYTGTLSGNNNIFQLSGQVQNGKLNGRIGEEKSTLRFIAGIQNQVLTFAMGELDMYGNLISSTARILTFIKTDGTFSDKPPNKGDIIINNTVLSKVQIQEILDRYGIEPKPGNYWYDPVSGLYGVTGYPSFGFMYPGHSFGVLSRNASSGNTGVLVNGRELPQLEWIIWSYIIGNYIQPGSYWLDARGNAGYEGNNTPVLNLFILGRQNAYSGKGGVAGDNFWSTRFSAGNSNADNTQGYVSVPGYGPVGYGF